MAREPTSRADLEAELKRYRDEWSRLSSPERDPELNPRGASRAASSAARISAGDKSRLDQVGRRIDELEAALKRLPAEEAGDTAEGADRGAPDHPILEIEGRFARVSYLLRARLADGDNAFSESTRTALKSARLAPVGESDAGDRVVGPASLVRACLADGARIESGASPETVNQAVAAYVLGNHSWDATVRARLAAAASAPPGAAGAAQGDVEQAIADGDLTRALAGAARLVRRLTPRQTRVDIRHALLAALRMPQAQRVFFELDVVGTAPEEFFHVLFDVVGVFLREHHRGEAQGWAALALELVYDPAAAPALPVRRSEAVYVADAPATTLAQDRLGVADEARALAEVMCLREPGPPLAIGLFGDWGSGKSTFMNMIEVAVDDLTTQASRDPVAGRTLVRKVVHVKFNAWHYNDANLWASLTAEFFSQLRVGGHAAQSRSDYAALVRDVLAEVARLEGEVASQGTLAALARRETESLGAQLADLEARRGVAPIEELTAAVRAVIPRDDDAQVARVRETLAALGHPVDLPADKQNDPAAVRAAVDQRIGTMCTEVERAASFPGRLAAVARALGGAVVRREWTTVGLLVLALLVAAGAIGAVRVLSPDTLRAWLVAAGTMLVGFVPVLAKVYRVVEPVFRAAADYTTRLRKSRAQLEADIARTKSELAAAERKLGTATTTRARREAEASRLRGGTPEQVFDYFLNVAEETQRFERELGTVSRVRRAFEQLDAIFDERERLRREVAAEKAPADDGARTATGGTQQKEEQLRRLDDVTAGIDRIVLYIDDLDRCQVQQVVRVLEAVHLLLAFPLFVVVVGVDARWLQQSLLEFYNRQLRGPAGTAATGTDHRAPVQDYLEKIFQVPLHLRRLDTGKDGRFRAYLDSIVGPVALEQTTQKEQQPSDGKGGDGQVSFIPTLAVKLKPPAESAREVVERITLRPAEVEMMEALAPFHGKSPRAVKRFVNVYRLIRGLRRGEALVHFLDGVPPEPPSYPAVLFWLAVEVGRGPEASALLHQVFTSQHAPTLDAVAMRLLPDAAPDGSAVVTLRQSMDAGSAKHCAEALQALAKVLPGEAGVKTLLAAHAETQRFAVRQG